MCTKDTAAAGELLGQIAKILENAITMRILIAYQTMLYLKAKQLTVYQEITAGKAKSFEEVINDDDYKEEARYLTQEENQENPSCHSSSYPHECSL